jgi:hypothetical protein
VSYVDNAIADIPSSGGSSYTFTNGLTESNGTVSWDLNEIVRKNGVRNLQLNSGSVASGGDSLAANYARATEIATAAVNRGRANGSYSFAEGDYS